METLSFPIFLQSLENPIIVPYYIINTMIIPYYNPIWQTSRRNFYRPHFKYKIVISPQRNVYFRVKKGVSELKGLTFPSRFSSTLFSLAGLVLSTSRQLLDILCCFFQQVMLCFPPPLERANITKVFLFSFIAPLVVGMLLGTESFISFHQLSIPPVWTDTVPLQPTLFFTHHTPLLWLHCRNSKECFLVFFL